MEVGLEAGLSLLQHPDREARATAAAAVTASLEPGLRTRAFVYNTLLLDKSVDDRLRHYDSWVSSRNLSNEADDDSVEALIEAVVGRYDIAQRWYSAKAQVLGVERLADYDRMASVASDESTIGWSEARRLVLDAYGSFSPSSRMWRRSSSRRTGSTPRRATASARCVLRLHGPLPPPYVLLNWTSRNRDEVLTLAHELGHGLHACLHPTRACSTSRPPDPRRDRLGLRRGGDQQRPARGAGGPRRTLRAPRRHARGLHRHGVPAGGDEPLRACAVPPSAEGSASSRWTASPSCGPTRRRRCSATPWS
ncbi:MAG: hypothetical protein R2716_11090 [Microthrixaceae bacterium]